MNTNEYRSIVGGKTIALVGPAKYMEGSGYGSEIDSHDLVVRINRGIESIKNFSEDIGQRTDIYYSCLIERYQQTGKLDVKELRQHYNIKCIVAPPKSDIKGTSHVTKFHYLVDLEKAREIEEQIPIRIINHEFHTLLAKEVQCKPNTGFLSIYDLLSFNIKRLSIYGFSFYLDGFLPGQKAGIEQEKGCSEDEFAALAFKSKRHIQKNMWEYAKANLLDNERVQLDPFLQKILNLSDFSKDAYVSVQK